LNYQPKTQQLQMGFRKANASEIVDVVQCPVLVPILRHCCRRYVNVLANEIGASAWPR
jgi:tRNA/tmRNA/rRNA uracil-C5-methylase (TrmA/RlmC/RlmD family)